jgi:uncharacterized membrane protein YGL010W
MKFRPQHFHLTVAACAGLGALVAIFYAKFFLAFFLLAGGAVALTQWKGIKSGVIDL